MVDVSNQWRVLLGGRGTLLGGVLAEIFKIKISIANSLIISEIVVAFVGAILLLFVLRIFGFGRGK